MLAVSDLEEAFQASEVLIHGTADPEQIQQAASWLRSRLQKVRCLPVALGSAQASLAHKLKASAHADRMEAESWAQVACLARNTFTRTGDLGTESGMSGSCAKLTSLFGSWICESVCTLVPIFTLQTWHCPCAHISLVVGSVEESLATMHPFQVYADHNF